MSLTVSNSAGSDTQTEISYITVDAGPVAAFTTGLPQGNVVSFNNASTFGLEAPAYTWDFGDGQTSTATSPDHTYLSDGTYTVGLTAENSCGVSPSSEAVEIVTVSTGETLGASIILISPNPAVKHFSMTIAGSYLGFYQVTLSNGIDQLLEEQQQLKTGASIGFQFEITNLSVGVYFLKIVSKKGQVIRKVVVE